MNNPTIVLVTIIGNRILFNLRKEDAKAFNFTESIELANMAYHHHQVVRSDLGRRRIFANLSQEVSFRNDTPLSMVGVAV